jgi:hypothetical protein
MISMIFPTIRMCEVQFSISGMIYIANERHEIKMHLIIFRSILVYICSDNTVFLVFCVHENYLSHFQTEKMHQIDFIQYAYTTYTMVYVRSVCLI